jgi:hypothetical protein
MSDHPTPDENLCDALLGSVPPPDDPALRQRLLRQTTRLLRRRVWGGRLLLAGLLAACYLAGVLTARLATDIPAHSDPPPVPPGTPAPAAAVAEASTPALLEERAFDSLDERSALYRRAGDRYAAEQGDWESALRCYRNSLDVTTDKDLTFSPGDNWLVLALKEARKQEKKYAQNRD